MNLIYILRNNINIFFSHSKMKNYPFVSICTPTFNRRPFIKNIISCFLSQTYPRNRMEWIIVDDGTDKVGDLFKDIPEVKYFPIDKKMTLGSKRNFIHKHTKGSYILYMDDDDYYPVERVQHAIEMLEQNPNYLIAGSSEMYIYFKHVHEMYQFGPYNKNHSTAATFCFRKELLNITSFQDEACLAEEKHFLKDYTIPMLQLDSRKTILVFSHIHNTFDKKTLIEKESQYVKKSTLTVDDFIVNNDEIKKFFMEDIDDILEFYDSGKIENKPDVLLQLEQINKNRKEREEEAKRNHIHQILSMNQLELANIYEKKLFDQMLEMKKLVKELEAEREKTKYLNKKISEIISKSISEKKSNKQ
jgi:glycosyltransferase involved in cell wall biosynthesis